MFRFLDYAQRFYFLFLNFLNCRTVFEGHQNRGDEGLGGGERKEMVNGVFS